MVFADHLLHPHLDAYDNLAFSALLRRDQPEEQIDELVEEVAELLALTSFLDERPSRLDESQRQRVALGRAIVREPAVFLFDEPLSNLDAKMRVEMRSEIIHLHQRLKSTIIYVTHDQTEAMTMGGRIVVMNEGRIQQVAPPLEVYRRPANPFVAGFIGTPAMNLFPPGMLGRAMIGVRPEDLKLVRADEAQPGDIEAVVDFVEPLGSETLVHIVCYGFHASVRCAGFAEFRPGERLFVKPDMTKAVEFA
jgi:multiple sugar transport system ATP-binding protein